MVICFCKDINLKNLMAAEIVVSKEDQEILNHLPELVKQSLRDKVNGSGITDKMVDLINSIVFFTVGREKGFIFLYLDDIETVVEFDVIPNEKEDCGFVVTLDTVNKNDPDREDSEKVLKSLKPPITLKIS